MMDESQQLELLELLDLATQSGDTATAEKVAAALRANQSTADDGFSFGEMARNIIPSGKKYLTDIYTAVTNPGDTLRGLGNLAGEALSAGGSEESRRKRAELLGVNPELPTLDAASTALRNRYGSIDAALNTLETDPVGALADLSGATSLAGKASGLPGLNKAGIAIDPLNLAVNPVKAAVGQIIPRSVPTGMYESAAKFPPRSVPRQTREKIVEAALNEGIMPTSRGIDKVNALIGRLDNKIDMLIKQADKTGKKIPRTAIYSELKALRRSLAEGAAAPGNLREYKSVVKDIDEFWKNNNKDMWSPSDFQRFKTATYRDIKWKGDPTATTETMQALARGARKQVAKASPEIAKINKRYGPLAELRDNLGGVANRIDNHNPLSLSTGLYATAGGSVGDALGAIAGAAMSAVNNPKISAAMAIKLRDLQNKGLLNFVDNSPTNHMVRQALLQSGRLDGLLGNLE